jgi:hypothetical protein
MSNPTESDPDLESRISTRRDQLTAKLFELKTDTRVGTTEVRDKLKARLSELAHIIREGVVDGWASLGDKVTQKLDRWLAESAAHLPAKNGQS